jgi:NhaA family Na+:H+ antiporter
MLSGILLNFFKVRALCAYLLTGLVMWYFVLNSGIHPTIAGVLIALTLPMPEDVNRKMMAVLGMMAGIGFTMSIFITTLSFQQEILSDTAKLAVICGSLLSAAGGLVVLRFTAHEPRHTS